MGDAEVKTSQWRLVEVGRVVLFAQGPFEGKLATIVEIIDHKRVLVDGPASTAEKTVPRHASPLSHLSLTPIVIPKLPRGARNGVVKKVWEATEVEKKFGESAWAKNKDRIAKRRALNDFERFKVMRLRKQVGAPRNRNPEGEMESRGRVAHNVPQHSASTPTRAQRRELFADIFDPQANYEVKKNFAKLRASAKA
ncbi:hypothetical protein SLS58_007855 [Diplodia intermedia]|uniref:60S ribosomal protein L14 n=1 Tax=Diplodia intermedia TaxID=856260 RepID=A0ABR3TJ46_9PEZI